jgi:tetratricopeptide (TPR) repeat protein
MRNRTINIFATSLLLTALSPGLMAQANEGAPAKNAQVSALIKKGISQAKEKDYHQAINSFNEALALDPNSFDVYVNRGWTSRQIGDFAGAISDYTNAIKIQSTKPQVYLNRGWCHKRLGQMDEALKDFDKALELDPKYLNAYRNRGSLKLKMGDYSGAVADFNQLLFLDPDAKAEVAKYVPSNLMDSVNKMDPKQASKIGSQVAAAFSGTQINISDADLAKLNNRAARAIKSGEFESAIGILEDIAKKKPNYSYAKENLATAYNNQGLKFAGENPEKSAQQFRKAMFYSPQQGTTRTNLNAMLKLIGKDPESAADRISIGDELKEQGDYKGAFVEYMEAMRLKDGSQARQKVTEVCALIEASNKSGDDSTQAVASNPAPSTNPGGSESDAKESEVITLPPVDIDTTTGANTVAPAKPRMPLEEAQATALDLNPPPKVPIGQDTETIKLKWHNHIVKGDELFEQGNYIESEAEYKDSLVTAKKLGEDSAELISSLERVARIFLVQKRPVEALSLLEQAYNLRKQLQENPDPMHLERLGQKVLALRKILYPQDDPKKDVEEEEPDDSTETDKTASKEDGSFEKEDTIVEDKTESAEQPSKVRKLGGLFKRKKTAFEKDLDSFETTEKPSKFDDKPSWSDFQR